MKLQIGTTLIAGTIAALLAGPTLAATDNSKVDVQPPVSNKAEATQAEREHPALAQPTTEKSQMGTADGRATARTMTGDNVLYMRTADDLYGKAVIDRTGDKVGEIKRVVLAPDRKSAHAVISVGGVLGMGARDISVSLDELKPMDDKLQMNATKEEIAALKDATQGTEQYVDLKGSAPISGSIVEFSAFEQGKETDKSGAATMKPDVDADKPGYPSRPSRGDADKPATAPETPSAPR